jgi:hypothetical protein
MRSACLLLASLVLAACNEGPRCELRGAGRGDCDDDSDCPEGFGCGEELECQPVVIECNAGKVPVCGMEQNEIYQGPEDPSPGALRPVPSSDDGTCDGFGDNCRTRPLCDSASASPTCADGRSPVCVRGAIEILEPETPTPDAGMMTMPDAGMVDAGMTAADAGMTDAGMTDAGMIDAGM